MICIAQNSYKIMLVPYTNPWICLPSLKRAWDLVYTGQNHDVSEILGTLIGKSTLDWCIIYQIIYTTMLLPHQSQKSFNYSYRTFCNKNISYLLFRFDRSKHI